MTPRIVYFISSHGFGHAARACAVIEACRQEMPGSRFAVFTAVPQWFFEDSLGQPVEYHHATVDLGLVQANALEEDLPATVPVLERSIPFSPALIEELAARVRSCSGPADLVVCDIAPLGIPVARRCGVPSLLIENFTWDWIYRGYAAECPELEPIAEYLEGIFTDADHRIQAEPFCSPAAGAERVAPVSRRPRSRRDGTRRRLGVPADAPLVMVTMGGIEWNYDGVEPQGADALGNEPWLVIPGAGAEPRRRGRCVLLPHRSEFFHPDLVTAADAVIGKLGYSTVAEVYRAGIPFGYVARSRFPESPKLEAWVQEHLPHRRIEPEQFTAGRWGEEIARLLELPRRRPPGADGAREIARLVRRLLYRRRGPTRAP